MIKQFIVNSNGKSYKFEIGFHKSDKNEDQQIEPDFYRNYSLSHEVYEGIHYEMEVISTEIGELKGFEKIHIHTSLKNGKKYICWTGHLSTEAMALLVTKMWCAGSIFTIEHGEDFGLLPDRHEVDIMDFEKMIEIIRDDYGILVSEYDSGL